MFQHDTIMLISLFAELMKCKFDGLVYGFFQMLVAWFASCLLVLFSSCLLELARLQGETSVPEKS